MSERQQGRQVLAPFWAALPLPMLYRPTIRNPSVPFAQASDPAGSDRPAAQEGHPAADQSTFLAFPQAIEMVAALKGLTGDCAVACPQFTEPPCCARLSSACWPLEWLSLAATLPAVSETAASIFHRRCSGSFT